MSGSRWQYPGDRYYECYGQQQSQQTGVEAKSSVVGRSQENLHIKDYDLVVGAKKGVEIRIDDVSSSVGNLTAGDDCWHTPWIVDISNELSVSTSV